MIYRLLWPPWTGSRKALVAPGFVNGFKHCDSLASIIKCCISLSGRALSEVFPLEPPGLIQQKPDKALLRIKEIEWPPSAGWALKGAMC